MKTAQTNGPTERLRDTLLGGPTDGLSIEYVGDDVLILNDTTGKIHWFNNSAAIVWKGIAERQTTNEIANTLRQKFNVSQRRAEQDIDHTLEELIDLKLFDGKICRQPGDK